MKFAIFFFTEFDKIIAVFAIFVKFFVVFVKIEHICGIYLKFYSWHAEFAVFEILILCI